MKTKFRIPGLTRAQTGVLIRHYQTAENVTWDVTDREVNRLRELGFVEVRFHKRKAATVAITARGKAEVERNVALGLKKKSGGGILSL